MRLHSTIARYDCGVCKLKKSKKSDCAIVELPDRLRIRNANILLISIKALANEIAKNLVLAGIGSITLADHEVVTEDDLGAQFFISEADVGKNVR